MKSNSLTLLAYSLILISTSSGVALAETTPTTTINEVTTFSEAFTKGTPYINFRYRYEYADDDAVADPGLASTLRTRLGFKTASFYDLSGQLEIEDVSPIGNDLYNSTVNGKTNRAVVADPDSTEINQAFLSYSGITDTTVKAGRHRFVLDNHRFLGDVGWRQNDQTHDGVVLTNTSLADTELLYAHTENVNRIFGDDSPVGDLDSNINVFHFAHSGIAAGKIASYVYLFDVNAAPKLSSASYGASFNGSQVIEEGLTVLYDVEYAFQHDYENNPTNYQAHYWRAGTGLTVSDLTAKAGFESLGSDHGTAAFSTPFATLHRWNGWADKFLTTPDDGLHDAYAELRYAVKGTESLLDDTELAAVFHHFSADDNSTTYGTEWDLEINKKLAGYYIVGVKYASYNAKSFSADTQKLIFSVGANYGE